MAQKAPGKHFRNGISLAGANRIFADNEMAEQWFIGRRWPAWRVLPILRFDERQNRHQPQDDAFPLP